MEQKNIFFNGLAEIRAIAALSVIFHHIELYKYRDGLNSLNNTFLSDFILHLGKNGVYVFFVLSGFLITYLLLAEREKKGTISVKKFYLRRILRIWPLYYFIIFLSFIIIPFLASNIGAMQNETHFYNRILELQKSPFEVLVLFLIFLPNLALKLKSAVVGASQTWSVGVEEQFYIVWPHLFNLIKSKKQLLSILVLISFLPFISLILSHTPLWFFTKKINYTLSIFPINFMASGSVGAFILFYYKKELSLFLKNKYLFAFIFCVFFISLFYPINKILFAYLVVALILFIIQKGFRYNLRSRFLQKIGTISYGVYMYHPIVMYFCFSLFNSIFKIQNIWLYNIAIYFSIFPLTLIISKFSYDFFEKKFIDLKNKKFTVIKSGTP